MESELRLRPSDAATALMTLTARVSFMRRPSPVVGDLRLTWRLPLLLLTLHLCCRNGQSSHKRLHLLNWAVRSPGGQRQLLSAIEGRRRPQDVIARTDPVLSQVIDYALGEGLLEFPRGDRVKLTTTGRELANSVLEEEACLEAEKAFLGRLGRDVTEDWVDRIMSVGTPSWA
jgi:hypothetical protein